MEKLTCYVCKALWENACLPTGQIWANFFSIILDLKYKIIWICLMQKVATVKNWHICFSRPTTIGQNFFLNFLIFFQF